MLEGITVLIMLATAYAYLNEDLFTACVMCCNVFGAGLVAFNFWEPLASALESLFAGTFLLGYEDALVLTLLFCISAGLLRLATHTIARNVIEFPLAANRAGAAVFGLLTGYLVTGFLVCVLQTLPWHENFLFFQPEYAPEQSLRSVLPPDRVWLALMRRAGAYAFSSQRDEQTASSEVPTDSFVKEHRTFDKYATFELRYARYRRYTDTRPPLPYMGELDAEVR